MNLETAQKLITLLSQQGKLHLDESFALSDIETGLSILGVTSKALSDSKTPKKITKATTIDRTDNCRCMARLWKWDATGEPLQCQKKKKEGFGDFCGQHGKKRDPTQKPCKEPDLCGWNEKKHVFKWECCGRVDEPVPKQFKRYHAAKKRTQRAPPKSNKLPQVPVETPKVPVETPKVPVETPPVEQNVSDLDRDPVLVAKSLKAVSELDLFGDEGEDESDVESDVETDDESEDETNMYFSEDEEI